MRLILLLLFVVCSLYRLRSVSTVDLPKDSITECGHAKNFTLGDASRGEFPWLVAIYRITNAGPKFLCIGSLVSTRTVLTAAHCVIHANEIQVVLGRHNLEDLNEVGSVTRQIENIKVHPEFDDKTISDADLALLQMDSAVSFSEYIQPICVWNESDDNNTIIGQTAVVTGWGIWNGSFSSSANRMETNIVSAADCLRSHMDLAALLSVRTICAGNRDDAGPCGKFLSGAGLIIERNGRWIIRGIASAGRVGKCDVGEYVIYCDLAKHIDWLKNNLSN